MVNNSADRTKSTTERVRETIRMRPSLTDALKMKIVNYSALARMLRGELGDVSLESVKAAVIRIAEELSKDSSLQEEKVLSILRESNVKLQDKIAVLISPEILDIPYIVTAYLTDSYVYIVDQTKLKVKIPNYVKMTSNLTALILISPPRVENTPGFVAFMTQLLASKRINIVEFISCSTNTVIVLDSKDALNAFALIQNYV
ncbi:hypothetical protein KEJ21_06935 [Candidatus Bathyarchaeota archaeon]|nr:hypothetical protein [Candidatus Bathyarchaeota archaeon]MBS7631100.1 hypothetical protein [Candidatus Bathyarchaeota archaeon]